MCLHLLNMLYSVLTSVFLIEQAVSSNIHSEKITLNSFQDSWRPLILVME